MISYDLLAPALNKWAHHYRSRFPQFSIDELINAVFELGYIQRITNIRFASARIRYDMAEYIRQQLDLKRQHRIRTHPLDPTAETREISNTFPLQEHIGVDDEGRHIFECRELLEHLMDVAALTQEERQFLLWCYDRSFSTRTLSRLYDRAETWVYQRRTALVARLRSVAETDQEILK